MRRNISRSRAIAAIVITALYIRVTTYIDPTLRLLLYATVSVIVAAAFFVMWRARSHIRSWYSRQPLPIRGSIAGCVAWGFCILWTLGVESDMVRVPDNLRFVMALITAVCGLIAYPVERGGWLFLWGNAGAPYPILDGVTLNLFCGVMFNTTLGAALFPAIQRLRSVRWSDVRWSVRTLMWSVAFLAVGMAAFAAYFDDAQLTGNVRLVACACGSKRATIVDGKLILAEPNHDNPAGSAIGTIQVDGNSCTVKLMEKDGSVNWTYELTVDHLGAKCVDYDEEFYSHPFYIVLADNWKLRVADFFVRLKRL